MVDETDENTTITGRKLSNDERKRLNYIIQRIDILDSEINKLKFERENLDLAKDYITDEAEAMLLRQRKHYIRHRVPEIRAQLLALREERKALSSINKGE